MEWQNFLEQFEVLVHTRSHVSEPEKLAYLQEELKDGPARYACTIVHVGLLGLGSAYQKAIDMFQKCYNWPRLLHQVHVLAFVETPALKEGNGKELC